MPTLIDLKTIEDELTTQIGQQETSNGSAGVGASLNNPGGIKFAPWEAIFGASKSSSGFASFPSLSSGYDAEAALIDSYIQSGLSLQQLIEKWSPASDNNTNNAARVDQLSNTTGLNPNQSVLSQIGKSIGDPTGISSLLSDPTGLGAISNSLGFSWSRIASFLIGIAFTVIGLLMLKQSQVIVKNVMDTSKKIGTIAASAA